MTLTINDTTMTSGQIARRAPRGHGWEASWLPGQLLDRNATVTAITLAGTAAERDLHEGHRLWPHIQGWAAQLGLTGHDAVARASQPPGDIREPAEARRRTARPGCSQVTSQHDPRRNADDRMMEPPGPFTARDRR